MWGDGRNCNTINMCAPAQAGKVSYHFAALEKYTYNCACSLNDFGYAYQRKNCVCGFAMNAPNYRNAPQEFVSLSFSLSTKSAE